jgi:hypothetical protein
MGSDGWQCVLNAIYFLGYFSQVDYSKINDNIADNIDTKMCLECQI